MEESDMHSTMDWVEMCRIELGSKEEPASYYRLANELGITRQMMSRLKDGKDLFSDHMAIEAARILGLPPAVVVYSVHAEKAGKAGRTEVQRFWVNAVLDSWRIAWYVKAYAVIDKIRTAKAAGRWPPERC